MRKIFIIFFVLLAGCTSASQRREIPDPQEHAVDPNVVIKVYDPCVLPQRVSSGIEVYLVTKVGNIVLMGKTNSSGEISLSKESILSLQPTVAMFCYQKVGHCTAIFVGPDHIDLSKYDRFSVDLPQVFYR